MSITPDEISRTKLYEGNVNHMYLDTNGNVTIGVGHLLANSASATALAFVNKSNGASATAADIGAEWLTIKAEPTGHSPSYYDTFCKLQLGQPAIDALLSSDLNWVESELEANFAGFDNYPQSAQAGLFDMAFNLGTTRLLSLFPLFVAAVRANIWAVAAAQCHRIGVQAARNTAVQQLFLQAAAQSPHPTSTPQPNPSPTPAPTPGSGSTGSTGQPILGQSVSPAIRFERHPAPETTFALPKVDLPAACAGSRPSPLNAVGRTTTSRSNSVVIVGLAAIVATTATVGLVAAVAAVAICKDGS